MNKLFRTEWQLLLFGFLLSFWSAPGQTFFISLFGGAIREELSLSHGQFGGIYSLATLLSAIALVYTGTLVDRIDLKKFSVTIVLGSFIGCLLVSFSHSALLLLISIFLTRHIGQGLNTLTSVTSMVRYLEPIKGKATAISQTGYSLSEAIMPSIIISLILWLGWRTTWQVTAVTMLIIMVPAIFYLLRNHDIRHANYLKQLQALQATERTYTRRQWTRSEVLRDKRFYMFLPGLLAHSILFTGFIFHQIHLIESKGWSLSFWGVLFSVYATVAFSFSLYAGHLIDKYGAARLIAISPLPLGLGLLLLSITSHSLTAVCFMLLLGLSSGFVNALSGPFYSELYGTKYLGSIKSLSTAMMVFSSSLSPFLLGWFFDRGVSIETLSFAGAIYVLIASSLAFYAYQLSRNDPNLVNRPSINKSI